MHVASRIDSVTVHRRGALVTRTAELSGERAELLIGNLPLALDDGSVRLRVEGGGEAIEARVELQLGQDDPELKPAWDERRQAAIQHKAVCQARLRDLEAALAQLDGLALQERPRLENEPPGESPTAARIALLRFREDRAGALMTQIEAARQERRLAREALAQLEDQHRRASTARQARSRELRKAVRVRLDGPSRGRLLLSYAVPGAGWAPSYGLRLSADLNEAELSVRALVRQRSREDWTGARLTLSTADLQAWTELPELQSLRIGRAQPARVAPWRPPPTGAGLLYADHDRAFGTPSADHCGAPAANPAAAREEPEPAVEEPEEWGAFDEEDLAESFEANLPPEAQAVAPPAPSRPAPRSAPRVEQQAVIEAHIEPQILDADPLVRAVDPRRVLAPEPRRREAVHVRRQPRVVPTVGGAQHQPRRHDDLGGHLADAGRQGPPGA